MNVRSVVPALFSVALCLGADTVLIAPGSTWKYLDNGSNQKTAWQAPAFDDGTWKSGAAQFGFGDGDEATVVGYGPNPDKRYITTYFRRSFTVTNPAQFGKLTLNLLRDDGAVVYINGSEVFRSNMPAGGIAYDTLASVVLDPPDEATFVKGSLTPSLLKAGTNTIAVEVHQAIENSVDLSFDLSLIGGTEPAAVIRGPYLQTVTTNSIVVQWRTDMPADSRVLYGTTLGALNQVNVNSAKVTDHAVKLTGLSPDTKYYYSIGTSTLVLAGGDATHYFFTSPPVGTVRPIRIWAVGDWQYGGNIARLVRNAYASFTGNTRTDVWLTMGDNSETGLDSDYQQTVFEMFPSMLRNTAFWPAMGNHDTSLSSGPPADLPYFLNFTLPTNGEAGGVPSGSERYYSYDYGNVHFICLDSMTSDRSPAGPMLTWLKNDLAATRQRWIIAYWHHPPYSKGPHDSDVEPWMIDMRRNAVPILEAGGADLVLTGHSHVYERSYLIDGHYGQAASFVESMKVDGGDGRPNGSGAYRKAGANSHEGTVYVVAGVASGPSVLEGRHPVTYTALEDAGSLVLDVNGDRLDAKFILASGVVFDSFTITKGVPSPPAAPRNLTATPDPRTNVVTLTWVDAANNETGFYVERNTDGTDPVRIGAAGQNATTFVDRGAVPGKTYYYRVLAYNAAGNFGYSNTVSATIRLTTPAPPGGGAPNAPSELTAVATPGSAILLTWRDNAQAQANFIVERLSGNGWEVIATVAPGVTTWTDSGLTAGMTYAYRVKARNSAGDSAYSATESATIRGR